MDTTDTDAQELVQREDVQRALRQAAGGPRPLPRLSPAQRARLVGGGVFLLGLAAIQYAALLRFLPLAPRLLPPLERLILGAMGTTAVLLVSTLVGAYLVDRIDDVGTRYNLRRLQRFIVFVLISLIVVSILFANWYTAAISLGILSVMLGFALQTPITSLIGWVYILVREPYRVGDRIRIAEMTGDVIDVGYFDTTLWEFGGEYLSTEHPSGRIIKFPNSQVLTTAVYNYSWPLFPYIWNEVKFNIAYDSDLEYVASAMQRVADEELGESMAHRVRTFQELLARTPVDRLEIRERPRVLFRVSANTWLEAIVRYVVAPREAGSVKTRLIRRMLEELNREPERVAFPKGSAR